MASSFKPLCSVCCRDLTTEAVATSCYHLLCKSCFSHFTGRCVFCDTDCQVFHFSDAHFPPSLRDNIVSDPVVLMARTIDVYKFQMACRSNTETQLRHSIEKSKQQSAQHHELKRKYDELYAKHENICRDLQEKIDHISRLQAMTAQKSHNAPEHYTCSPFLQTRRASSSLLPSHVPSSSTPVPGSSHSVASSHMDLFHPSIPNSSATFSKRADIPLSPFLARQSQFTTRSPVAGSKSMDPRNFHPATLTERNLLQSTSILDEITNRTHKRGLFPSAQ